MPKELHRFFAVAGGVLVGVMLLWVVIATTLAMLQGRAVLWVNYKALPVGTYEAAIVILVAVFVGVVQLARWMRRRLDR